MAERILVVGGSGDIGSAIVSALLQKGCKVATVDVVLPKSRQDVFHFTGDISQPEIAEEAMRVTLRDFGSVDALVLSTGFYESLTLEQFTWDGLEASWHANFLAPIRIVMEWLNQCESESGPIVFIGSAAAHVGSRDISYSASKAALGGLAKSLSINLAPKIPVFTVSPGIVDTKMSAKQALIRKQEHISRTLLKRPALPEEVAQLVAMLVTSPPIYMSGTDFNISGGIYWS